MFKCQLDKEVHTYIAFKIESRIQSFLAIIWDTVNKATKGNDAECCLSLFHQKQVHAAST
jgi:hypothetical protein